MLRVASAASLCLCIHLSFITALGAAEPTGRPRPLPSQGEAKILAALGQVTAVDFKEKPLTDVIDFLTQKHEIDIQLDTKALSDAGVGSDTPITVRLEDITLRSALRLLLGELDLTWVVSDGYLLITSKTEAENMLSVKVYPVRDLVTLDSEFRPPLPPDGRNQEDYQSLMNLITTTVAPTTWDEVGGPGSMQGHSSSHSITFSQTGEVHEEAIELLTSLRRVRDQQIAAMKAAPRAEQPQMNDERPVVRVYRLLPVPAGAHWPTNIGGLGMGGMYMLADDGAAKNSDTAPSTANGATSHSTASQPPSGTAATEPEDRLLEKWSKELAQALPELVEPGTWAPAAERYVRALAGAIVVRQTPKSQQKVAEFLAELLPGRVITSPPVTRTVIRLPAPGAQLDWPEAEPRAVGNEAAIQQALTKSCRAEFREEPLANVIETLAAQGPLKVWVDSKALSDAGVGTDTPVTRSFHGLTLRTAFKLLLGELDLTYVIRNEVFTITSKTEAENLLVTKVYPVFDLVAIEPGNSRGQTRPVFDVVGAPAANFRQSTGLDFTPLVGNITSNIAPTTWDEVGGPGAIQPFVNSGALVISQTTEIHEQIVEYLKALREVAIEQRRL